MIWFEKCKHDWEIKVKEILPSAFEQLSKTTFYREKTSMADFKKKIIVILSCKKCGELNKTIEENP